MPKRATPHDGGTIVEPNAGGTKAEPAAVSLVELSEFAILGTPQLTFGKLAGRGCVLTPPTAPWRPLSGGLEYNHFMAHPIRVDEILSSLIVEITRTSNSRDESWVNGFELRPSAPHQTDWTEKIRAVLARNFELAPPTGTATEAFFRDGTECLLIPRSSTELEHLLLHRRAEIDNDD